MTCMPMERPVVVCRCLLLFTCFALLSSSAELHAQTFSDITSELGIANVTGPLEHGKGISFHDIDRNGWDDLTISASNGDPIILLNTEGTFSPAPFNIINSGGITSMLLWGDMDNDGDADLFVSHYQGRMVLYRNDGDWQFTNVSQEAGLDQSPHRHAGAAWADYDHDGCLDLYVAKFYSSNYEPESGPEYRSILYRNNCDGTFTNVTEAAGVLLPSAPHFLPVFLDYDHDGWEDLFVVIDRPTDKNELFHNNGDGTFTQVTAESGMGIAACSMSGSVADYDLDADLDVFVSNGVNMSNLLLQNNNDGTFAEVWEALGLPLNPGTAWGGMWVDLENDGDEDLFIGEVSPGVVEGNYFYRNDGGSFVNVTTQVGLEVPVETYVVARGDLNNDGYHDLMTNNGEGYASVLYRNSGGSNHYLSVAVEGTLANRDGIGTWITCHAGGQQQVRYTLSGSDYMAQNSNKYIFGLGELLLVDSLVLEWNSGTREVYHDLAVDQHLHLVEGMSFLPDPLLIAYTGQPFICPGGELVLDGGDYPGHLWSTGAEGRYLTVPQPGTYTVTITDIFGNTATSEALQVQFAPPFTEEVAIEPVSCAGLADGSISVSFSNPPATIAWNTGGTGTNMLDGLASGAYSYVATDAFGCVNAGGGFVPEAPPLTVTLSTTPASGGLPNGTATLLINGGEPAFTITWSTGQEDVLFVDGLPPGDHQVTVVDAYGCTISLDFTISVFTGLEAHGAQHLALHPVPARDVLYLTDCGTDLLDLEVLDLAGRRVLEQPRYACGSPLPVGHLPPATYVLRAQADGIAVRIPFVRMPH